MKKLMIAAAIVCAAALSQAATVTWGVNNIGEGGEALSSGYAYVFSSKTGTYKNVADLTAALAAVASVDDFNAIAAKAVSSGAITDGSVTVSGVDAAQFGTTSQKGVRTFALLIDTATVGDATKYYVTTTSATFNLPDFTTTGSASTSINAAASSTATWTAVSVPEPTSAMLLLLGMAGLALRRRRA